MIIVFYRKVDKHVVKLYWRSLTEMLFRGSSRPEGCRREDQLERICYLVEVCIGNLICTSLNRTFAYHHLCKDVAVLD